MPRPRVQFGVGWLASLVGLVALNLAAGMATSKTYYPRRTYMVGTFAMDPIRNLILYKDGSSFIVPARADVLFRPQMCARPRPTLLHIWSPFVAGLTVSCLILGELWQAQQPRLVAPEPA